jgi:hypothetical protein
LQEMASVGHIFSKAVKWEINVVSLSLLGSTYMTLNTLPRYEKKKWMVYIFILAASVRA